MNLCPKCWDRGRHLIVGECICTGHIGLPTSFHAWSVTKRINHMAPVEPVQKPTPAPTKQKLEFGKRPETTKKKKR